MIHLRVDVDGEMTVQHATALRREAVGLYLIEAASQYSRIYPATEEQTTAFLTAQAKVDRERGL